MKVVMLLLAVMLAGCAETTVETPDEVPAPVASPEVEPPRPVEWLDRSAERFAGDSRWYLEPSGSLSRLPADSGAPIVTTPFDAPWVWEFDVPATWIGGKLPWGGYLDVVDVVEVATDPALGGNGVYPLHRTSIKLFADGEEIASTMVNENEDFFFTPKDVRNVTEAMLRVEVVPLAPASAVIIDWSKSFVVAPTAGHDVTWGGVSQLCFFVCIGILETFEDRDANGTGGLLRVTDQGSLIQGAVPGDDEIYYLYIGVVLGTISELDAMEFGYNLHGGWDAWSDGLRFQQRDGAGIASVAWGADIPVMLHGGLADMELDFEDEATVLFEGDRLTGTGGQLFGDFKAQYVNASVGHVVATGQVPSQANWTLQAPQGELALVHASGLNITVTGSAVIDGTNVTDGYLEVDGGGPRVTLISQGLEVTTERAESEDGFEVRLRHLEPEVSKALTQRLQARDLAQVQ